MISHYLSVPIPVIEKETEIGRASDSTDLRNVEAKGWTENRKYQGGFECIH